VRVKGGLGGDAEVDIVRQRANAIKILANLLQVSIVHQHVALYLIRFEGGESADTIPANAEAVVAIPAEMDQEFKDIMIQGSCAVQAQYGVTDPDVEVLLDTAVWHGNIVDEESTRCLLADLNAIPTGPLEMRSDLIGTAMTSNSIGCVRMNKAAACFEIFNVCKSFKEYDLNLLVSKIRQILEVSGAEMI
jgi:dipeptidase D